MTDEQTNDPVFFSDENLGTSNGFFSRKGGISSGLYDSLNCGWGSKDNPSDITTNRALVLQSMGAGAQDLVTAAQVHSNRVQVVDKIWTREKAPEIDAMVTDKPAIALGILTADCAPVLFSDPKNRVIGAAHAGWRGAFDGVLENTIDAMISLGADRTEIKAAIGPCIHQKSYEVDQGFYDRFLTKDPAFDRFFIAGNRADHYLFDLAGFVSALLMQSQIAAVTPSAYDTYSEEALFYSFRRKTHRGEADYARQISVIVLDEA